MANAKLSAEQQKVQDILAGLVKGNGNDFTILADSLGDLHSKQPIAKMDKTIQISKNADGTDGNPYFTIVFKGASQGTPIWMSQGVKEEIGGELDREVLFGYQIARTTYVNKAGKEVESLKFVRGISEGTAAREMDDASEVFSKAPSMAN